MADLPLPGADLARPLLALLLALAGLLLGGPAWSTDGVAALLDKAREQYRVDPEASRRYAERALKQLESGSDVDLRIRAHTQMCEVYAERDRQTALAHAGMARTLLPQARRPGLRARVASCEGEVHEFGNDTRRAAALYQESVTVAEQHDEREMLADALFLRGYLNGIQGGFAAGLADLQRAHSVYEDLGLPQQQRNTINGIAGLYSRVGDYQQARSYFETSLQIQSKAGLTRDEVVTNYNLGRVLERLKDWSAAERSYNEVLRLSRQIGYVRGEAYALRGLAQVQNALGNHLDALTLLEHAALHQGSTSDEMLLAQILLQRGTALRGLQRLGEGVEPLRSALELFMKAESAEEVAITRAELARLFAQLGDWKSAYEQHVQYQTANTALLQRQLDQRYASLTMAKDKENALLLQQQDATQRALNQERRATRLQGAVIMLIVVLTLVLATLAWRSRRTSEAMHRLAMTDELTGVPNRRQVLAELAALQASGRGCAVLIVDIDHFKSINDEHGHLIGDEILRAVSTALRDIAHEPVKLGRLGGEEFLIASPEGHDIAARRLAERLLARIRSLDLSQHLPSRRLTISIGLTVSTPGDTIAILLRRADEALYAAKANGRNCVVARMPGAAPGPTRITAA